MFDSLDADHEGQQAGAENTAGDAVAIPERRSAVLPIDYEGLPAPVDTFIRRNLPAPRRFGDEQRQSVAAFLRDNPEFEGQPDELVAQDQDTHRSERQQQEDEVLHAEGVPQTWDDEDTYTDEVVTSDDL